MWEAAELQAQFSGSEAFPADLVVLLRGVERFVAASAA